MDCMPLEQEVEIGRWPRVRARVRRLQQGEVPAVTALGDDRMVEYFRENGPKLDADTTGLKPYTPLRDPDLLSELLRTFARDEAPSEAEVVAFYRHYGPLGGWWGEDTFIYPAWAQGLAAEDRSRLFADRRMLLAEPLWWVRREARGLRLTYELYAGLRQERVDSLRSLIGEVSPGKRLVGVHILAGQLFRDVSDDPPSEAEADPAPPAAAKEAVARLKRESLYRQLAARLLTHQLNLAESRSRRRWVEHWVDAQARRGDRPLGRRRPDTLEPVRVRQVDTMLAAAYLQLAEIVSQQAALRQCPGCRGLFFPRRTNQHYCTARCGDAARQRAYHRDRTQRDRSAKPKRRKRGA